MKIWTEKSTHMILPLNIIELIVKSYDLLIWLYSILISIMYVYLGGLQDFLNKKCLFSEKKALRIMNFAPFNVCTTLLFKNCNMLKFADIINVESCVFINDCFNKDSFSVFNENFKYVSITHSYITTSAKMVYCLYQVITQSDLGGNQLSIQPLLQSSRQANWI